MATVIFIALLCYLAIGVAVGLAFVSVGVVRVQHAPVTLGARILLLPGATLLWPLIVSRWIRAVG
jgi:hypothetical protein